MMHKVLDPEQVSRVLYNIANFCIEAHGGEAPEDIEMTDIEYIAYKTMKERIKGNLENAAKRKPGGAPEGNKNAQAKDKEVKMARIKTLADLGLKPAQIAAELPDISESTIRRYLKEIGYFPSNKHKDLSNKHKEVSHKQSDLSFNHNYNNIDSCLTDLTAGNARQDTVSQNGDHPAKEPADASDCETPPTAAANQEEIDAMWSRLEDRLYSH
jgi:hypothetical protein